MTTAAPTRVGAVELSRRLGLPHPPTDEQAEVIESGLGPAVVVAGAGSGKTETMAARVVWLIANRLVAPDAVLGLTFTRKAAGELSKRIRQRLGQWRRVVESDVVRAGPAADPELRDHLAQLLAGEPTVLTYAAHAGRLVADHAMRLGAEPGARLLSPAVAWQLADAVSRRHPSLPGDIGALSSVPRYILQLSGQLADHLTSTAAVEDFCRRTVEWFDTLPPGPRISATHPGSTEGFVKALQHRRALMPLLDAFAAAKAALPAVDFADQMTLAARLARLPEVREIERERYGAVLLDEYQDTGHAQVETLVALFGDGHPVTAVGDPLQSIYGWRGASSGTMQAFTARFRTGSGAPAPEFHLATSFRNDQRILVAANTVAAPLRDQASAVPLRAAPRAGAGEVAVLRAETVEGEAAWLAGRMLAAWSALPPVGRTAAVLVRRRSQLPLLADALLAVGLPVEVVGLGGLLTTPEIVDVVATLRVLVCPDAGTSVARLLTGARWRLGPADIAALHRRAIALQRAESTIAGVQGELFGDPATDTGGDSADIAQTDDSPAVPPSSPVGLVEALDDLGPPEQYSADGYRRLRELSGELRRLRRRIAGPLPELVADVERTIGVDIEVEARPDRRAVRRAHLDRFLDEAADFANEADEVTLTAFLAYLDAAEDEENGLEAGEVVVETDRVQLLTVHGAKGLEWDIVAVPGLAESIFPAEPKQIDWTKTRQELPIPLRGDRHDLPGLDLPGAQTRKDVRDLVDEHTAGLKERHGLEERRLAYVALTRARHVLLASSYAWDATQSERRPSRFLSELSDLPGVELAGWFEVEDDAVNPLATEPRSAVWPIDPFGPYPGDRGAGRRAAVRAGADLVLAAARGELPADPDPAGDAGLWRRDVDVLLRERAALARGASIAVPLPPRLSVSQLVELGRDPDALAQTLRRPVPHRPAPATRRGTRFHTWLEQRWSGDALLDIDELPGAADPDAAGDDAATADFDALRRAFESSEWADRTPHEIEVPFEMTVDGQVIRGRMDAVFRDPDTGGWIVVDWKTGSPPTGTAAKAAAVQLAAYRLAWARLIGDEGAESPAVRAVFHYVREGQTVEPAALLDEEGLRQLVRDF